MAIVAVDPKGKQKFIPETDKEAEDKTVFFYHPLTESEKADIAEKIGPGGIASMPESFFSKLVKKKCAGWENFNDSAGKPIDFAPSRIDRIPWEIIIEFGMEIFNESGFGRAEEKN